ncbi:hypothetical protein OHT20_00320 [Streptomyces caniferus]|uniref:hypothetical protein n=1 Tax=Streptomyces caniferus TaxID=285557 RepID=UPI002E2A71D7|nr:hypothetical protein [Streptomyces caniferus]
MSGRGRRAVLPPTDFQATQRIAADGLQVTVVNKEGFERVFDFAAIAAPQPMRCSLARAFAQQSMGWNSHASGESYWRSVEVFARFLKDQGHLAEDLGDLTSATLRLWRNNHKDSPGGREALAKIRTLLKNEPQLAQGLTAEELARPVPKKGKPSKQSYRPSERDHVLLAAERQFRTALLRIRENTTLLARYRAGALDPASRDWRIGAALEHIAATGELPGYPDKEGKVYTRAEGLLRGKNRGKTTVRLFLTRSELTALAVMMTDHYGWNLSVYDRLHVPVITPSAGETTTITYEVLVEKRRSGEGRWFDTENYTDSGANSPGRLITQALEATQHGRALAAALSPGHDLLMVARNRRRTDVDSNLDRPRNVGPLCFGVSKADASMGEHPQDRLALPTRPQDHRHDDGQAPAAQTWHPRERLRPARRERPGGRRGRDRGRRRGGPRTGPRLHLQGAAHGRGRRGPRGDRNRGLRGRGDQPLAGPERGMRRRLPALPVLRELPGPHRPPPASRPFAPAVAIAPFHLAREALAQAMG